MYFIDARLFHGKIIEQRMRVPPMRTYIPGEKSSARKDTKINEERRSVLEYRNTLYTLSERDTGPFSRRTGIIISSAPCRDRYEARTSERSEGWGDDEAERPAEERDEEKTEKGRDIRYRWEREYRVLQTSRQLPGSWLHGPSY